MAALLILTALFWYANSSPPLGAPFDTLEQANVYCQVQYAWLKGLTLYDYRVRFAHYHEVYGEPVPYTVVHPQVTGCQTQFAMLVACVESCRSICSSADGKRANISDINTIMCNTEVTPATCQCGGTGCSTTVPKPLIDKTVKDMYQGSPFNCVPCAAGDTTSNPVTCATSWAAIYYAKTNNKLEDQAAVDLQNVGIQKRHNSESSEL